MGLPTQSAAPVGNVTKLLTQARDNIDRYLEYFNSVGLPEPSYEDGDGLTPQNRPPAEVLAAQHLALEATDELHHLLLGPRGLLLSAPGDHYLMLSLQCIYRYKIAKYVPLVGETSFEEISLQCGLNVKDLRRFLRVAISRHVFAEPSKGYVRHTAASKLLLGDPLMEAWIMNIAEEFWPALSRMVDATTKWPGSEEPNECGYSLGHNTTDAAMAHLSKDSHRHQRFMNQLKLSHLNPAYSTAYLLQNYDFGASNSSGQEPTIVDIGGSRGEISIAITRQHPNTHCIVQDLPDTISNLEIPEDVQGRVESMQHDFFTPQPVKGADVYFLRWILHDWSDEYGVRILRGVAQGMGPHSKVVVNEICVPEPGECGIKAERECRMMDISMKAFSNARERDAQDWAELFAKADSRFRFEGVRLFEGHRMAIITAGWEDVDKTAVIEAETAKREVNGIADSLVDVSTNGVGAGEPVQLVQNGHAVTGELTNGV